MLKNSKFISGKEVKKLFDVSTDSLHRWDAKNLVNTIRTPGGNRLYNVDDIKNLFADSEKAIGKKVIYARVSFSKQEEDLEKQIAFLLQTYPNHEVIKDIGSGLDFKRKGFVSLLERVYSGEIKEIVVLYKDRLCRFGFELLEFICKKSDARIVVFNKDFGNQINEQEELSQDLLSIITVFVARNNGKRSAKNKKRREIIESTEDKIVSEQRTEEIIN